MTEDMLKYGYQNPVIFQHTYEQLRSLSEVARFFNISESTASRWKIRHRIPTVKRISDAGVLKRNGGVPYVDKRWFEEMYRDHSMREMAEILGCNRNTLNLWAKRHGIKLRTYGEHVNMVKNRRKLRVVEVKKSPAKDRELTYKEKSDIYNKVGLCQSCGEGSVLEIHHIDSNRKNNSKYNIGVLCPNCHARIHRIGIDFHDMVEDFIPWCDG